MRRRLAGSKEEDMSHRSDWADANHVHAPTSTNDGRPHVEHVRGNMPLESWRRSPPLPPSTT